MNVTSKYTTEAPQLPEVQQTRGPLVLECGTSWCGHCRAAQPHVEEAVTLNPEIPYWKIEDGKGWRLGRAFQVLARKSWQRVRTLSITSLMGGSPARDTAPI